MTYSHIFSSVFQFDLEVVEKGGIYFFGNSNISSLRSTDKLLYLLLFLFFVPLCLWKRIIEKFVFKAHFYTVKIV